MQATAELPIVVPTIPGTIFEGGFYAGRFRIGTDEYALIVAPKAEGETEGEWGEYEQDIPGARSFNDGRANTAAMAEAGSGIAAWALALEIEGRTEWYLPSRDELEICYRAFKPGTRGNWVYRHGENPSSLPVGYPYTAESPAQTGVERFQNDGSEAFDLTWYWTSTQFSPGNAWNQDFDDGRQDDGRESLEWRARAVRRFKISN